MDTKKIVQQGEEKKVHITITRTGFVMNDDVNSEPRLVTLGELFAQP